MGSSSVVSPQRVISTKPVAASSMPTAVTRPAGEEADEVAAEHGADRQREQEPDQHQRRGQLGVGVDGGAGEQRDVDEGGDQRGTDEEADQQRPPCRRTTQRAARHQRVRRHGARAR